MQSELPATCILADPETVVWMVLLAQRQKKATMAIIRSRAGRKPEYDSRRQLPVVVDPHEPPVFVESRLY